jgi:hypothetical protein
MVGRTQALGWRCTQAGGDGPSRRRVAAAADGACGRRSAQVFETVVINYCLYAGAAVGFYQGDTLKILDDLTTLRPTVFVSVPRLYTRFYDKIVGGAKAKGGIAAALFGKALSAKLEVLHATGQTSHALWDTLVFKKVQKTLGLDRCSNAHTDRRPSTRARTALCARACHARVPVTRGLRVVRGRRPAPRTPPPLDACRRASQRRTESMVCGSAPIAANVKDFLRVALDVKFVEGYGLSETAAAASICHPEDVTNHHVGSAPPPAIRRAARPRDLARLDVALA